MVEAFNGLADVLKGAKVQTKLNEQTILMHALGFGPVLDGALIEARHESAVTVQIEEAKARVHSFLDDFAHVDWHLDSLNVQREP